MYEVFSEPEIILYYKCDVSMNHDIKYYVMFEMFCNKLVSSCEDTHINAQASALVCIIEGQKRHI